MARHRTVNRRSSSYTKLLTKAVVTAYYVHERTDSTPAAAAVLTVALARLRRLENEGPPPTPPYRFCLDSWVESACLLKFRFSHSEINMLAEYLDLSEIVRINNGCCLAIPRIEALCIVLHRLAYPIRYGDLVSIFGRSISSLSQIHCEVIQLLAERWEHLLSLDRQGLQSNATRFSEAISFKTGGIVEKVIGFIDGTGRPICRPEVFQKVLYSGHHRRHELHYQIVISPDGLARSVYGFEPGRL